MAKDTTQMSNSDVAANVDGARVPRKQRDCILGPGQGPLVTNPSRTLMYLSGTHLYVVARDECDVESVVRLRLDLEGRE